MASHECWRVEFEVGLARPTDVLDRIRLELETAVNRFTIDIEARLRHEFAIPTLVVRSQTRTSNAA
jgi:hypothetical protein